MKPHVWLTLLPIFMSAAENYTAQRVPRDGVETVRLTDAAHKVEVTILPSSGNTAVEMKVNGTNIFWFPSTNLSEYKAKPVFAGNPLLAPWANRLDHAGFYANGKHYSLDEKSKIYRGDAYGQSIHGFVTHSDKWQVVDVKADSTGAVLVSRLEMWRHPDYMAQFPFAHTIEVAHRLSNGTLEVETSVQNHATEPMPLSLGYHPYFKIHDAPRDQWTVQLPAREHVKLSPTLVPTGDREPLPWKSPVSLSSVKLDDVMTGLIRGEGDRADFSVKGQKQQISVLFGPKYPVAVVYAPEGRDFICFEPMTGPTNAFNLHHAGKYPELQTIPAGGTWKESFWVVPSGF
ncbi:MAG TPA: aldose 1-epimerase [Bryobacteraceae bacterium]|nr:aldose 1-epimerase [Bryobacteraceae bacterium]